MAREGSSWSGYERNCAFLNCGSNNGTFRFADISAVSGLDFPEDARSIGVVDWDHDGDLDLWFRNRTAPRLRLMVNQTEAGTEAKRFVAFKLTGTQCNRDAIGARVELKVHGSGGSAQGQPSTRLQTLHAGDGFLSQSSKWLHFGLGNQQQIDEVLVHWPGGETESFGSVQPGGRYLLREGSSQATDGTPQDRQVKLVASVPTVPPPQSAASIQLPRRIITPELTYRPFGAEETTRVKPGSKPLLVTLWASWCQSCVHELRSLGEAQQQLRDAGVDILALSVDHLGGDDDRQLVAKAEQLLHTIGFPFSAGIAERETLDKVNHLQSVLFDRHVAFAVPFSFLLDEQRRLVFIYRGPVSADALLHDLASLNVSESRLRDQAIPFAGRWYTNPSADDQLAEYLGSQFLADYPAEAAHYYQKASQLATSADRKRHLAKQAFDVFYSLAVSLLQKGAASAAEINFQNALSLRPDSAEAHSDYGALLAREKRSTEAKAQFRRALELRPDYPLAKKNLEILNKALNRPQGQ